MQTEKNHTKMQQNTFYNKLIFKIKVGFLWVAIKLLYGLNRFTVEGMENITKLYRNSGKPTENIAKLSKNHGKP